MSWPEITLGEVAEIVSGATPSSSVPELWDGSVLWATPTDLSRLESKFIEQTERTISESGLQSCSAKVLPSNSVLFSSRAPIGLIAINKNPMATNQGFKSFVPKRGLDSSYLYWWLKANRERLQDLGNGATFKELSKAVISRVSLPLPPIEEQRRIAKMLDRADAILRKRARTITLAENLLKSLFLEMFGHPLNSSVGHPRGELRSLGKIETGKTPPSQDVDNHGTGVPFVTPGDLGGCVSYSRRQISPTGARYSKVAPAGSTMVCCIGATIGKMGFLEMDAAFNQQINSITWGPDIEPVYGYVGMTFYSERIAQAGTSTTLPILKKSLFSSIDFPVPEAQLQKRYGASVREIWGNIAIMRRNSLNASNLFASLSQTAFRGEL